MLDWIAAALLIALAVLAAGLLVTCFVPRPTRWNLPLLFAVVILAAILTGWLALVTAEIGVFSVPVLIAALAGSLLLLLGLRRRVAATDRPGAGTIGELSFARWEWAMLAIWIAAALWLFFRPHEYIYGGADAGVYVSLGAEIAQHGGFRITDETLANMTPAMRDVVLRPLPNTPRVSTYLLPGFYVTDAAAGEVTPQFYPFHPVLQAVAFGLAGGGAAGIRAELLLTGVWMLLGTLAVYLTARDIGGPVVGALALAGLSISALQVWFGRYPTSEALTQFLLWSGIWSGGRWLDARRPPSLWAFTAGCAFGAVFLVRIDSLVLLPIFGVLLLWRWFRGWERPDSWFAAPFALLVVHSLLHGHFLSAPYFYETLGYGFMLLGRLWPFLLIGLAGLALVLYWLPRRIGRLRAPDQLQRIVKVILIGMWLIYAFYGWFIRPEINATTLRPDVFSAGEIPVTNHENWLRLGWYLSPIGIWLGVAGSALMLWRVNRWTVLALALGLMFSGVYLWNISANPHHVYVMRRYVPAVMPFFILCGAYLIGAVINRLRGRGTIRAGKAAIAPGMVLGLLAATIWLAGIGLAARGFVSQVDHTGLVAQVDDLAAMLPSGAVLLFNDQSPVGEGDVWGTPLRFVYGFDAFALRRPPDSVSSTLVEAIKTWQNNGRPVIWIGGSGWLDAEGMAYETTQVELARRRLESSYTRKPTLVDTEMTTLTLHYLEPEFDESE